MISHFNLQFPKTVLIIFSHAYFPPVFIFFWWGICSHLLPILKRHKFFIRYDENRYLFCRYFPVCGLSFYTLDGVFYKALLSFNEGKLLSFSFMGYVFWCCMWKVIVETKVTQIFSCVIFWMFYCFVFYT